MKLTTVAVVTEVSLWLDGKSVKWVQATWLQSVKANERGVVRLTRVSRFPRRPD